jgi:hypothetical protein
MEAATHAMAPETSEMGDTHHVPETATSAIGNTHAAPPLPQEKPTAFEINLAGQAGQRLHTDARLHNDAGRSPGER